MNDQQPMAGKSHKLWGGRFAGGPAPELEAVNRSIDVDFRLWPFDVQLSKAWAVALSNAGVLTSEESKELGLGLDEVARRIQAGVTPEAGDEDIHTWSIECCTRWWGAWRRACTRGVRATIK